VSNPGFFVTLLLVGASVNNLFWPGELMTEKQMKFSRLIFVFSLPFFFAFVTHDSRIGSAFV
jgi:hypothetical protein